MKQRKESDEDEKEQKGKKKGKKDKQIPSKGEFPVKAEKSVLALTAWARRTRTAVIPVGMEAAGAGAAESERQSVSMVSGWTWKDRCPLWPSATGERFI